jgi:hypothetical protein
MTNLSPYAHGSQLYQDPPEVPEPKNWCCMCEQEKEDATDDGEGICAECLQEMEEKKYEVAELDCAERFFKRL